MKLVEVQRTYKMSNGEQITIGFEVGEGSIMRAKEVGILGPDGSVTASFGLSPNDCQYLSGILARTFGGEHE